MNSGKQKRDFSYYKSSYYKSILLVILFRVLFIFRRALVTLPNGFMVVIIGLPILSLQFWGWAKYRHRLYRGHSIIGQYVKYEKDSWSYWVQVDRKGWVEHFEVAYPVYRVLRDGDIYNGRSADKYSSRLLNRPVAQGMVDRARFEWNMIESLQEYPESGYYPLRMEVAWTEKSAFRKAPSYIFYVAEWTEETA